jgi:DtxR family Mn-dependent transcriptional regulator
MLGRPAVDPHGDDDPTAQGRMPRPDYLDLMTAPTATPLVVIRVIDQDPEFLRFVEQHRLMPGRVVTIEERDGSADAVRLRGEDGRVFSIGRRAATKVLARLE